MSFLGLYRDPVVAEVTRRCDWRIGDIVAGERPTTLYLVVPPSDINRTKPLIRLILNQIGRRLTEDLQAKAGRRRLLLMLDEFPALGRLDFFESALAFMAGYGIKSFLIAQSLNQIEKAYGPNNSILDNCHVRVSFATNDERTAKRGQRRARHGDRDEGDEELCRQPALALARTSDGLAIGDGAPAAHAGRGHATPAYRRDRHGVWRPSDPREEGALLRGCAVAGAHPAAACADAAESRVVPTTGVHGHCPRGRRRQLRVTARRPTMKIRRTRTAVASLN